MLSEVYDALREIGVPEDKARKAAEALASHEPRLERIEARLTFMQWELGIIAAIQLGILAKLLHG